MWRVTYIVSITILSILFFEMLFRKVISLTMIKNAIVSIFKGIINRFDKLLTGNDELYSHIKFINLLWGIGSFSLICLCVLRGIKIQGEIIILMGGAIGISAVQAVANKTQEVKAMRIGDEVKNNKN